MATVDRTLGDILAEALNHRDPEHPEHWLTNFSRRVSWKIEDLALYAGYAFSRLLPAPATAEPFDAFAEPAWAVAPRHDPVPPSEAQTILQLAIQFSNDLSNVSGVPAADIMQALRLAPNAQLDLLRTSAGWAALSAHLSGDPTVAIVPGLH